jgi:putative transposase
MAYIDLNPVRAGLVADPADYQWSSHQHYIGRRSEKLITPHPIYWELGNTPFARDAAYAELVRNGIGQEQQQALTDATLRGWALGEPDYVADLQRRTERRVSKGRPGRPKRVIDSSA